MFQDEAERSRTLKDLPKQVDVINQILLAYNCPTQYRSFIDGLIGMSQKSSEFKAGDLEVANYVRPATTNASEQARRKWVQRQRDGVEKWQEEIGINFIECEHGSKVRGIKQKSFYRIHLIDYANKVIKWAREDVARWDNDPDLAIQYAVIRLFEELQPGEIPPKPKAYRNQQKEALRKIRSAKTNLENAATILEANNAVINEAQLIDGLEEIIERLKRLKG